MICSQKAEHQQPLPMLRLFCRYVSDLLKPYALVATHRGGVRRDNAQDVLALHVHAGYARDMTGSLSSLDRGIAKGDKTEIGSRNSRAYARTGSRRGSHRISHVCVQNAHGTIVYNAGAAAQYKRSRRDGSKC